MHIKFPFEIPIPTTDEYVLKAYALDAQTGESYRLRKEDSENKTHISKQLESGWLTLIYVPEPKEAPKNVF